MRCDESLMLKVVNSKDAGRYHAFRTIKGVDEMKRNEYAWRHGGMKFAVGEEKEETPKKPIRIPSFTTRLIWSDRDRNSGTQRWEEND